MIILVTAGCRQKEEPDTYCQFPPVHRRARDDIKLLKEALKTDREDVNAWIKTGNTVMDTFRFNEANDAYHKALDLP